MYRKKQKLILAFLRRRYFLFEFSAFYRCKVVVLLVTGRASHWNLKVWTFESMKLLKCDRACELLSIILKGHYPG